MVQQTSSKWKNAVRQSSTRITVVDLHYNHQPLPVATNLAVSSGSITIDRGATNRRAGSLVLVEPDLVTQNTMKTLEPYGLEVLIRQGIRYSDGSEEFVNVGIFVIDTIEWDESTGAVPTVTIYDRSYWFQEQSSSTGSKDFGGHKNSFAIQQMLDQSVFNLAGTVTSEVDPTTVSAGDIYLVDKNSLIGTSSDTTIPGGAPMQDTFWNDIVTQATAMGCEIFFEADGVNVILERTLKVTNQFVSTIDAGPMGNLISADRQLSRQGAYNAVQMTGALASNAASTATPPSVFVYDSEPSSPTYYFGPFGRIVLPATSTATDKTVLLTQATTLLQQGLGLTNSVTVSIIPDAALDPGDRIQINFLNGDTEYHMIQTITLDLAGGPMSITTLGMNQL